MRRKGVLAMSAAEAPGMRLQLAAQVGVRPADLVVVAVGQGAAEVAEPDGIGMTGSRAQDCGVTAASHEPDPAGGRQAFQPRAAQAEIPALPGNRLAVQQRRDHVGELGKTPGTITGRGPLLPDVVPLPLVYGRRRCPARPGPAPGRPGMPRPPPRA
jgi:hypothetical protein